MSKTCSGIQKSLGWCEGKTQTPGMRRRIYYLADSSIVKYPQYPRDTEGRVTGADLVGSFELAADEKWRYIDILPEKSKLSADSQGEYPSVSQLVKLVAVHPGVGAEATASSAYINNTNCHFLVPTMAGEYRWVGSEDLISKCTVAQDCGDSPTSAVSTTINAEVTMPTAAPFYHGKIVTEDGEIDLAETA